MSELLLHPEYLRAVPVAGAQLQQNLRSVAEAAADVATDGARLTPGVSVVIRTRNDAQELPGLFEDLAAQEYSGDIETIVVDACSNDGTADVARSLGARVLTTERKNFHNAAIDAGVEAASHDVVLSLVGHTRLATSQAIRTTSRWLATNHADAVYGVSLPGKNASLSERAGALILKAHEIVRMGAVEVTPGGKEMGVLAADCALIKVDSYASVSGLDPRFEAGGADGDLAKRMYQAGKVILRDPILAVHHTHGLNPVRALRQLKFWSSLGEPQAYGTTPGYDYCADVDRKVR